MAYDEQLATRARTTLKGQRALVGKRMFGGFAPNEVDLIRSTCLTRHLTRLPKEA